MHEMDVAFSHAPLGLTVLDKELRYVHINRLLADLNGVSPEDHIGKTIYEVVPEVAAAAGPIFEQVLRTGEPIRDLEFEGATAAQPSVVRTFRESVYPVRGRSGDIVGVCVAAEDITESKRLLAALHASEQRERLRATELESVMHATPAAVFIAHDRACHNVTANDEAMRLMRMPRYASPSLSVPGPRPFRVYADSAELAPEQLPLQVAASTGQQVRGKELEARFENGDVLHVLMNAVPLRAADGAVIGAAAAFVDITAQKQARQEVELQSRHKDEFLAVLAHELRNPLAAIQSGLELMKMDAGGTSLGRTREVMQRQMAHVVRLIDDLLDVARISSGKLELDRDTVPVREIVEAAIELARPDLERAGHQFEVALPPEPLFVHADRVRMTEVLCNLLHNAAKYTAPGGEIRLGVAQEQGQAVFRVADNGIGIAPEQLSQMFTMFAQAESGRTKRKGGLGVGLALASRLVELHGGAICADSGGPGQGSSFTVRLPLVAPPVAAGAPGAGGHADRRGPLRILVLDDNIDAATMMGAMLEACGHTVQLAFTGGEALAALARFDAQVAVLDIGLPDMSGYELARRIRDDYPGRDLFLVALTGWGSAADRERSQQAGIDLHLTKPVTLEAIEQLVLSRQQGRQCLVGQHA